MIPPPNIELHVITASEVEQYRELRLRALQESPTAFGSSYEREATFSQADFLARLQRDGDPANRVFGAFASPRQLVGMLGFMRESGVKRAHVGQLWSMYVAPEYRGQGVGAALLDATLAHAQDVPVRHVLLTVNTENEAARGLYLSRGFETYGLEPDALFVEGRYYAEEHMLRRMG